MARLRSLRRAVLSACLLWAGSQGQHGAVPADVDLEFQFRDRRGGVMPGDAACRDDVGPGAQFLADHGCDVVRRVQMKIGGVCPVRAQCGDPRRDHIERRRPGCVRRGCDAGHGNGSGPRLLFGARRVAEGGPCPPRRYARGCSGPGARPPSHWPCGPSGGWSGDSRPADPATPRAAPDRADPASRAHRALPAAPSQSRHPNHHRRRGEQN